MRDFEYQNQTELVFGRDAIGKVGGRAAAATRSRRAMLVHSGRSAWERPIRDEVVASLEEAGFSVCELEGVVPNPRLSKVREGVELARTEDVGIVIGLGGGSAIDTAKGVAGGACHDGDVWELYAGGEVTGNLPVGAVPTIAATGSEASVFSVVTNDDTLEKLGCGAPSLRPVFACMNPETTFTLPAWQTACGAADIMAHAMDTYFGDSRDVELQNMLLESVMRCVVRFAPQALATPDDYEARAQLMLAGTFAMSQQLGVGHSTNLAPHEIGENLGGLYDVTHGAVLAVLEPACVRAVMDADPERVVRFANRVFDVAIDTERPLRTAEEGIARLSAFFRSLGLPATLAELGIDFASERERLFGRVAAWDADGEIYQRYSPEEVDRILESVAG